MGIACISEDSVFFTIVSADSGKDLVFGDDAPLAEENIEVFYFLNGTRKTAVIRYESEWALMPLEREVSKYFIHAMQKTDTVQVQVTRRAPSECCPSTSVIEWISVNGEKANGKDVINLYR